MRCQSIPQASDGKGSSRCELEKGHSVRHKYGDLTWEDDVYDAVAEFRKNNLSHPVSPWCVDHEHQKCHEGICKCGCHSLKNLSTPEPAPIKNEGKSIWDLVVKDMRERDEVGEARYGTRLQAHNGRNALVDAYQESLDLTVYLRQFIEEERFDAEIRKSGFSEGWEAYEKAHEENLVLSPIPMVLHCPSCSTQHIDVKETEDQYQARRSLHYSLPKVGVNAGGAPMPRWTNPPHKSHLCSNCKTIWRPAEVFTTGVASVSPGTSDTWLPS